MLLRKEMTFKMKTTAVLCLVLCTSIKLSLSIPLLTGNVPERTKKSPQTESAPIAALLLVVPPTLSQFRDEDGNASHEDISFLEDQLISLLLRDVEIPSENPVKNGQKEALLFTEDVEALNVPRAVGDITVDEKILLKDGLKILSDHPKGEDLKTIFLSDGPLPSIEENAHDSLTREDIDIRLVPEESLPTFKDGAQNLEDEDSSLLEKKAITDERLSERSYSNVEYIPTPKPEQVIATNLEASENALPVLLNCAPKVERGHLAGVAPSYRNHDSKASKDLDIKNSNFEPSEIKNDKDPKNSDILDLNSPASTIAMDRRKRYIGLETGATHYKVSEDYPETFKGNHHQVSADYPQPNMVRITTHETSL